MRNSSRVQHASCSGKACNALPRCWFVRSPLLSSRILRTEISCSSGTRVYLVTHVGYVALAAREMQMIQSVEHEELINGVQLRRLCYIRTVEGVC